MFTVENKFTPEDFKQGFRLHTRCMRPQMLFVPVLLIWIVFKTVSSGKTTETFYAQCVVGVAVMYWFYFILPKRSEKNAKTNLYVENKSILSVDTERLSIQCLNDEKMILWTDIEKWRENKNTILLYPSNNQFLTIPKRILKTKQIEEIRSLLDKKKKTL